MRNYHYKLLFCGQPTFRAIRQAVQDLEYKPGHRTGFLVNDPSSLNRVAGRYIYTAVKSQAGGLDPETLEPASETVEQLAACRFEFDQQKGLVRVEGARSDLNVMFEALDAIPNALVEFGELNLNLLDLMFELQGAYKKNEVRSFKIRDYLAREDMLTNASFKVLNKGDAEKIAEKFSDQLDAFTLTLKLPDGACSVAVTRHGSIRASDEAPDELLLFVKDLLPRFHEAEVETAEVVDPA